MDSNEKHIIKLLQSKDSKSIELIYDQWGAALYGLILRIVKNETLAQDVLQDVMVKIWKNSHQYRPEKSKLFTWIYQITRNSSIDAYRKFSKRSTENIQSAHQFVSSLESDSILRSNELKLKINALEPKYKEVIHALFFEGMTQMEMSKNTGIPLGTIKTRLRIAMRELRALYSEPSFMVFLILLCYG